MPEQSSADHARPAARQALDRVSAPPHWHAVDFISDLHLHPGEPQTFGAWQRYLQYTAAQAVFILGDLFEVWVGDDAAGNLALPPTPDDSFALQCAHTLMQASARVDVFFMCGNRDFLVGLPFLQACGVSGLQDPCVLEMGNQRWVLSHGDALCLDDADYQTFRAMVRGAQWQSEFLAQTLTQRQAVARGLRVQSEQHKRAHPAPSVVDSPTAVRWLQQAGAQTLIHGHTHQSADHALGAGLQRSVLSDWDLRATPPRAQVLRLSRDDTGATTAQRLGVDAAC